MRDADFIIDLVLSGVGVKDAVSEAAPQTTRRSHDQKKTQSRAQSNKAKTSHRKNKPAHTKGTGKYQSTSKAKAQMRKLHRFNKQRSS